MDYKEFCAKYHVRLNDQQSTAVQRVNGATLLLAVPGSGKTTVIVARTGYLLHVVGIDPRNILTITFTKAAAREMKERFIKKFGEVNGLVPHFSTINSFCLSVIKTCAREKHITIPELVPNNEPIIRDIARTMMRDYPSDSTIKSLAQSIGKVKNELMENDQIKQIEEEGIDFYQFYHKYKAHLTDNGLMDFDDQLLMANELLDTYPDILARAKKQYRYISLDEAQDTSKIQHDMMDLLAAKSRNLFMVGDEDQSIYGFRAAYPRALVEFESRHPGAQLLLMETNYRSRQEIVRAADQLIQKNRNRHAKTMTAARTAGGCVTEIRAVSRQGQYNYLLKVAEDCEQETAVLYRNNESALPIIDMLERKGLSYRVKNTDMTFFSHPVVNDICDFIHLSLDPWDGETFLRIYYKMGAGISKKAAMEAVNANTGRLTLLDMVAEQEDVSVYTRKQCRALATHLDNMRYETAGRAIYRILNYMGYQEFMDTHGMDSGKAEILKVLGDREESLFDFPKRLQKLQEMIREGCGDPESKFILSTIHSSKGLEYTRVYLADMLAGVLPAAIPPGGCRPDSPEANAYEEERRLYYVGMTRAREQLYIFTFGPNMTSVFSGEVLKKPKERQILPEKAQKNIHKNVQKKVQQLSAQEVEKCIEACVTGCKVQHRKYGTGEIISGDGRIAEILFLGENTPRKISLPIAFSAQILTLK